MSSSSKQLIDNGVLETDWFLELPPKFKALYFMLRLTCSGVGFRSIGWKKISNDLGEPVTREEFDRHFQKHVAWLGDDEIWIHGRVAEQYKELSPGNKAHVNMARQVLEKTAGLELSPEAQKVVWACARVVGQSPDSQSTVDRESKESQETVGRGSADPNITITNNHKDSLEGGVGETKAPASEDAPEPFHAAPAPGIPQGPFELIPELQGEYSESALERMRTVLPGAQKAWLVTYPDPAWIREQATIAAAYLDTTPGSPGHHKTWGGWFGGWLHKGWKTKGQAPPGFASQARVPDYSQLK